MNKPLILAFALLVFAGCGPKSTIKSTNDVRLAGLTQIWTKYQAVNAGEVPKSLDEFKAFAEERGTFAVHEDLESVGDLFVSDADGQPFVMLFGKEQFKHGGAKVIAHEASATDGKVWIATYGGAPAQITESELKNLKK